MIYTRKGTKIDRYKGIVGKLVGKQLYVHKQYAHEVIETGLLSVATSVLEHDVVSERLPNFKYNCIMFNGGFIRFDSSPDFDTAREPHVGTYVTINLFKCACAGIGTSNHIWHHKWLWVKDDYQGFDVELSKRWSQFWIGRFNEVAKGTEKSFKRQLNRYGILR